MATYVNDLRLKEIATGDEAGTWGTSTNTNLELIGEALGYGTQNCFASDADATTTVADGATDPARAMYFKVTSSATLTATRTLTIAPNTISRVMLIENATTGSQSITISQGSGSTVTIASGAVKMVYLDGAGAGGAVVEALADLELPTVTVADLTATTADINAGTIDGTVIGGSTPAAITGTTITGTSFVSSGDMTFEDNDKAVFGNGSDLRIYHTGSHSTIENIGTGHLQIHSTDFRLRNSAGTESMILANADGNVQLYYDNALKLATTSTGIDVTGTVTADGLTMASGSQGVIGVFGTSGLQLIGQTGSDNIIGTMGANEPLVFRTVSTEKMRIASNGDISFYEDTGTTAKFSWSSANETISIGTGASSTATISAYSRTVSASLPSALRIIENTGASSYWDIGSTGGASNNLNFYANANTTPKMTLTGAGNVDIAGTVTADGLTVDKTATISTSDYYGASTFSSVLKGAATNTKAALLLNSVSSSGQNAFASIHSEPVADFRASLIGTYSADGSGAGYFAINQFLPASSATQERMRIDSSGNVGIGGTPTTHRLEVKSDNNIAKFYSDATATELKIVAPTVNVIGLYTGTADALMFGTADTERMRIDASGNVGIGTSSPVTLKSATTLQVSGNAKLGDDNGRGLLSLGDIISTGANVGIWRGAAGAYAGIGNYLNLGGYDGITFTTGAADISAQTERMRIDSSGNVAIGHTSANSSRLHLRGVGSAGTPQLMITDNSSGKQSEIRQDTSGNLVFDHWTGASRSERMRIDSSGNLLVGCTTLPSSSVKGAAFLSSADQGRLYVSADSTAARDLAYFINPNGVIGTITTTSSSTAYNTSSDYRLKENITDANDAGDKIDAIKVRQYDWKTDGSHQDYGMVAQELMTVAPEAVSGDPESDEMMGVDYSKLVPMMLKEIQSLRARVAQLEGAN
jgi:hypothetical protein